VRNGFRRNEKRHDVVRHPSRGSKFDLWPAPVIAGSDCRHRGASMRNLPVHWYEGAFLRPQHFQSADRYWAEQLHTSEQWSNPYHYGLHEIVFSREALANHQFEISRLQARLRDGTLVDLGDDQAPDRLDLKTAAPPTVQTSLTEGFEKAATIRVYLGVPRAVLGRANVAGGSSDAAGVQADSAAAGKNGDVRYRDVSTTVQDESWGGGDEEIQFRRLNVKLLLSTQDLSGYELLPLAQIKRSGEGEAAPQLDDNYIPPVIRIDAWPGLGRDMVRAVYDMIGRKIEVLSRQIASRGIGLESHEPGDADRILMLSTLNAAYSVFGVSAFAQGVHPRDAYIELCRIVGQLSIFGPDRRAMGVMPYDHDDLYKIFSDVRLRIEVLLNAVRDYEYEQRSFIGVGLGMQVTLEPKWFNSDWQWYIGVDKGDLSPRECLETLTQLDWKLGSSRQVELLFKHRAAGVQLLPVERTIRALPARTDWMYFEVPRQDTPAWQDVRQTQTLAMRLKDSLILNLDKLQGEQNLVVFAFGRKTTIKFALFAVQQKS
jgi:type VI secretion system protein ImpJ